MPKPLAEVFIPARAGSRRFPLKPLAQLAGRSVLSRAVRIAQAALPDARVTVLSESLAILEHARGLGVEALHIEQECRNGTERMACALLQRPSDAEIVINLQGDAVLVPPALVAQAAHAAQRERDCQCVTPIVPLSQAGLEDYRARKATGRASGTLAVARLDNTALYFTKGIAPAWREPPSPSPAVWAWRHVGLYAMRPEAALAYLRLPPTPLEQAESLEQLRWLEHHQGVRLVQGDLCGRTLWSIDHPEDLSIAADIIAREGELCP